MFTLLRSVSTGWSLALCLGTSACGSGQSPIAPSAPVTHQGTGASQVVVLGDSLAVTPSIAESFPAELQKRIDARGSQWKVVNAGVSGDITAGGLRRLESVITVETGVLVLALGANDGLRGLPIATVEQNLGTIIERARERGIRVLLCGMETPPHHGWDYTVEFHRLFPRVAERYGIRLVPFLLAGVALNPDLNGRDGIHPNAAGARLIADTVWPYLEPMIASAAATAD
jgi:acyl-CoA thioesterase I